MDFGFGTIIGDQVVDCGLSLGALYVYLAHVRHIEKPGSFAHCPVFIQDATVLNGQRPTAEINYLSAQRFVGLE